MLSDKQYWPAPAKLNLFLHITGQRADGYHLLQTVFQFLDIEDQIGLEINSTGEITSHQENTGFKDDEDLTLRAARLLQSRSGCRQGVCIELIKNLPVGGGVGGGSSDAATVLVVLNRLWDLGFSVDELVKLGLELGADVPVFIRGQACWAEGVGESFQPIDLPEPIYLLVYPKVHVSTGQIFCTRELTRNTSPIKIAAFLAGEARNDCELIVRQMVPEVDEAMRWLDQFAPARLTGTGSCVFAEFGTQEAAQAAADSLTNDWQTWVAQGYNCSSLHRMIDEVFVN